MGLRLKIITFIILILVALGGAGGFYYAHAAGFDNKKQYKLADNFYAKKQYQDAYASFLKIKYFSKYHKAALLKQALAAEKLDDWNIAENKYAAFCSRYKGSTFYERARYSLGKAYFKNKKYDKAKSVFKQVLEQSEIDDYKLASCYFLGKIEFSKNQITNAKKYFSHYLKKAPTGTYALTIAYDMKDMVLSIDEAVLISKIFLANQLYDEAIVVLKDKPVEKCWTYLAIAYYYKNDIKKFNQLTNDGYAKNAGFISAEDMENFTAFYLTMKKDDKKEIEKLLATTANKVIPDYLLYKKASFLPEKDKTAIYKQIVQKYPKSKYIPTCLANIFFDFANNGKIYSAIKVGEIYSDKFSNNDDAPRILFWTGKYFLKAKRYDDAKKYFNKVCEKYQGSYYAFRAASYLENNPKFSWKFTKKFLPNEQEIKFPMSEMKSKDTEFINLFLELGDTTVWEEIPFENSALLAWNEYKKGNKAKSTYLADKYIKKSDKKLNYDNPVWKLAFPIYYSDEINANCKANNLDAFLILSLIREESHFTPTARSSSNAIGLMQLLVPTASYIADKIKADAPSDYKLQQPDYNIMLGTNYFSHVVELTGSEIYAVGGYNGGPNAMNKWKEKIKTDDIDEFVESIPYAESKNYIKKVFRSRYNYANIYDAK